METIWLFFLKKKVSNEIEEKCNQPLLRPIEPFYPEPHTQTTARRPAQMQNKT